MLGRATNALLRRFGYELCPAGAVAERGQRGSHRAILENACRNGLRPRTIIDVGAAYGRFALDAAAVFPEATPVLVEPLEEYAVDLDRVLALLPGKPVWLRVAAAATAGTVAFNVHDDLVGSSMLREHEGGDVNGSPRSLRAVRLDEEVARLSAPSPYLLKVDVQGAELAVLDGATSVLNDTEFAILEASFFDFFGNGQCVVEVVEYMASKGFAPYDVTTPLYRPLDGAAAQIDICFVKKSGALRRQHVYATPEQRREQTARMRAALGRRGSLG